MKRDVVDPLLPYRVTPQRRCGAIVWRDGRAELCDGPKGCARHLEGHASTPAELLQVLREEKAP